MTTHKPPARKHSTEVGTPNRTTAARRAAIAASGMTPLEFMLSVLRDEGAPTKVRMWTATRAAPYCHARLRPVAATTGVGGVQVVYVTHEQRADELEEIDALARLERERVDTDNQRAVRDYSATHPVHGVV